MKKILILYSLFLLVTYGFQFNFSNSYVGEDTRKILIKFKPEFDNISSRISFKKSIPRIMKAKKTVYLKETGIQILAFPQDEDVDSLINELRNNYYIQYAEEDFSMRFTGKMNRKGIRANDPLFNQQWGLRNVGQVINGLGGDSFGLKGADIKIQKAWKMSKGRKKIIVALIDSGIDFTHPDLKKNLWVNKCEIPNNGKDDDNNGYIDDINGWDFVNNDNDPEDLYYHGTGAAGIIAATTNNNKGIAGINWKISLMVLKISPTLAETVQAIEYAVKKRARIINASWGENIKSDTLEHAINVAGERGILFVAAVDDTPYNNDEANPPFYPASYDLPNIISVAATDKNDELAYFSAYGKSSVDMAAPGDDIITTSPYISNLTGSRYDYVAGTSFATNFVTGVAALVLAEKPQLRVKRLRKIILSNTDSLDSLKDKTVTGGRLNAYKVLQAVN